MSCTCSFPRVPAALAVGCLVAAALLAPSAARAALIYSNDFQSGAGSEWSHTATAATPTPYPYGERRFLGEFGNDTVSLGLGPVAAGALRLEFDFYAIRSWDGSSTGTSYDYGDDHFRVAVAGGPKFLDASFSNGNPAGQSYGPAASNPYHTGAAEAYSLGYYFYDGIQQSGQVMDSVYRFAFDFAHAGGALEFLFAGAGLQTLDDESWGLDNVLVTRADIETGPVSGVPEPASLALLALGLAGLGASRARRRD